MKNSILSIILITMVCTLNAQQDHQYTQFMYNKLLINPAYAGARAVPFFTGLYRNQWMGFEGAPQSALLSFNTPLAGKKVGIGGTISHRKIGLQRDFFGSAAYSYQIAKNEDVSLRAGLMVNVRSMGMDFTKAKPLVNSDLSLDNQKTNDLLFNGGAGIYAVIMDKAYFGFSVPKVIENVISINNPSALTEAKESRHFYAMMGGSFNLNEDISIMPSLLLKYVKNVPFDADLNLNIDFRKKITLGASYRLGGDVYGESGSALVLFQATKQIGLGFAYDFTFSDLRDYQSGSMEILMQYDLRVPENNMSNPRFFF